MSKSKQNGFTLIEVMVALLIFSILSAATLAVLTSTLHSKAQMYEKQQELGERATLRILLKADFMRTIAVPKTDEFGQIIPIFFSGEDSGDNRFLVLSRVGWENPGGIERRSGLQAVDYRLEGDELIRRTAVRFNSANAFDPKQYVDQKLLSGIARMELQFFDGEEWNDTWQTGLPPNIEFLPKLASMDIHFISGDNLRQIFIVGADQ